MPRFATQGSVVIAHGSIKHGSLSCAKRQGGDGLAEERGCERPADPRLFPKEGFEGLLPSSKRGDGPGPANTGLLPPPLELEGLSKGGKAGNRARQLPRAVAGRVLRASLQVTIVLPKAPAQIDGCPDVRSAADGAPQAVDGERSGLAGRCPGLVERHLALALKFFIAAPQPRNFKASPRVNFVGWVTWDQAFDVHRNTVAGSTKFCRLSTKRCMGRTSSYHVCGASTKKHCPCRIRVPFEGVKCRFHTDKAQGFECAICLEKGDHEEGYRLKCGHMYHGACLHRWLCSCLTCPTCRRPVKDAKTMAWIEEFSTKEEEWLPEEVIDEDDIPMRVQRTRARRRQAAILANQSILEQILSILMPT